MEVTEIRFSSGHHSRLDRRKGLITKTALQYKTAEGLSLRNMILHPVRDEHLLSTEREGVLSFCKGVTCSVNTGGLSGKFTFGKGTQVAVISGESSQVAPFATL